MAGGDRRRAYDCIMCSQQEWESLRRRFEHALDDGQLRELAADALASLEAFVEEFRSRACAPEGADWVRGRGRRSRTARVA
jgi:hypothetical protein